MKIHFRTRCTGELTEYWNIEAPPDWDSLSPQEKLEWLQKNRDSADFVARQVNDEEDRRVIDFYS